MDTTDVEVTATDPIGAVYTPAELVHWMVTSALRGIDQQEPRAEAPLRILDPACGDGAFILGAFEALCSRHRQRFAREPSASARLQVAGDSLFGADLDADAVMTLRRRLSTCIAAGPATRTEIDGALSRNYRIGNALTGRDFASAVGGTHGVADNLSGIDWPSAFPEVAAQGGFDIVIGNPPYLREKDAKSIFDEIAAAPLGQKWRQPRMDLWHYFLHRGLDLLRPDGVLCFVINAYWMAAVGARKLIERLQSETTLTRIVLLGDARLFPGVTGRHMILQLRKGHTDRICRVTNLSQCPDPLNLLTRDADALMPFTECLSPTSLFDRGRLVLHGKRAPRFHHASQRRLGDRFTVRQGIAENPPRVTRRMSRETGGTLKAGTGVFVLTDEEVNSLELPEQERQLLRPYFTTAQLGRFRLPAEPTHWLLYLTRKTAPAVEALPVIHAHLSRFRSQLERRREVQRGRIDWWHLHWPRQERLFTTPRILAVQMCRRPQFVFAEKPTFVGFSVNVIQTLPTTRLSLPALTAILNSAEAAEWFFRHAKHRGVQLDISGTVLREFPLPITSVDAEDRLDRFTHQRQQRHVVENGDGCRDSVDGEIDVIVRRLYAPVDGGPCTGRAPQVESDSASM